MDSLSSSGRDAHAQLAQTHPHWSLHHPPADSLDLSPHHSIMQLHGQHFNPDAFVAHDASNDLPFSFPHPDPHSHHVHPNQHHSQQQQQQQQPQHSQMSQPQDFTSWAMSARAQPMPLQQPPQLDDSHFPRPHSSHAAMNNLQARILMQQQQQQQQRQIQQQQSQAYLNLPDEPQQPVLSSGLEDQQFVFDVDQAQMNAFTNVEPSSYMNPQLMNGFAGMPLSNMPSMSRPFTSSMAGVFPAAAAHDNLDYRFVYSQPHDHSHQSHPHQQTPPRSALPININTRLHDFEELSPSSTLSSNGLEGFTVTTPDSTISYSELFPPPPPMPGSMHGLPLTLHTRNESYHSHRSDMTTASASPRDIWQQPSTSPEAHDCDSADEVILSSGSHFGSSSFGSASSDNDEMVSMHGGSSEGTPWPISPEASRAVPASSHRRRGSAVPPSTKTTPKIIAKPSSSKDKKTKEQQKKLAEKLDRRVGKRKGPLTSDQRKQAGEIRKLKACLRCKFLKKTCDPNSPCAGCQPSHARLWMVPCTRLDIRDLHYFLKDWTVDYERHVGKAMTVANIVDYSPRETTIFISHGFKQAIPLSAREVFVRDDSVFKLDWVETFGGKPRGHVHETSHFAPGRDTLSEKALHDYIDRHLDGSFDRFVKDHFEGTKVWTEMLFVIHDLYKETRLPMLRNALRFFLTYNLTQHVTYEESSSDSTGIITSGNSIHKGRTLAPVMINFEIKLSLALMWREMHKKLLQDLSTLFTSVYSGQKQKNWALILMLSSVLLMAWEEMQFDSFYRMHERERALKFCHEMESTPIGVITGLFAAISQKMPALREWDEAVDSEKHFASHEHCKALGSSVNRIKGIMLSHGMCFL